MALGRKSKGEGTDPNACAHLSFVLGPSIGAARARVMLVIDGLEVRMWGIRDDSSLPNLVDNDASDNDDDGEEFDNNSDGESFIDEEEGGDQSEQCDDEEASASSDREGSASEEDDGSTQGSQSSGYDHCTSGSASPSPPSSMHSVPASLPLSTLNNPEPIPARKPPTSFAASRTEEQAALRSAERLLSRTLADACAEDGGGISCELCKSIDLRL